MCSAVQCSVVQWNHGSNKCRCSNFVGKLMKLNDVFNLFNFHSLIHDQIKWKRNCVHTLNDYTETEQLYMNCIRGIHQNAECALRVARTEVRFFPRCCLYLLLPEEPVQCSTYITSYANK